jgi:molybdate transport system regulatory protein
VAIALPGGSEVHAVITNEAADDLALAPGVAATALFKASAVMVAAPA